MVQKRAYRNEIKWRVGRIVIHDIELANLEIVCRNPFHQIGMNVACNHVPGGSDALCEPL
jgi:hypothetical protein